KIVEDGDRDGLPNVLVEAQSQRLACVSTSISAIAELIEPEVTGLLVPPDDPGALARELERLIRDPEERARLGAAGERRVRNAFSMEAGIGLLAARFGLVADAVVAAGTRSTFRGLGGARPESGSASPKWNAYRFLLAAETSRSSSSFGRP